MTIRPVLAPLRPRPGPEGRAGRLASRLFALLLGASLLGASLLGASLLGAAPLAAQPAPPPAGGPVLAAPPPILSDAARALPALGRRVMVATQEAHATRVGLEVLDRGGNATDAAVAVGFALAVTLPRAGNLGGGGFLLVRRAARNGEPARAEAVDYRETAPAAATPTMFLGPDGEPDPRRSRDSGLSVGVPGTVRGLALALERHGSGRFTLAELLAPAIRLAEEGIVVDDDLADSLPRAARVSRFPSSAAIFFPDGKPLERGARLRQPDLARTLRLIAERGPDGFHRGEVAEQIAAAVQAAGGVMTAADLAAYEPKIRAPVEGVYRGRRVLSMPPPSSGGVHLVQILNILERFDLGALGAGSAASLHRLVEAMKPAYADRAAFLGDPDRVRVPVRGLTSKAYAAALAAAIPLDRARAADEVSAGNPLPHEADQTTHYSIVDAEGNAVANTTTLNFSYGLGLVAPGTGVLLNNEMDDFSAKPGAQNAYGLVGSDANAVSPGARPLSSMTPTILLAGEGADAPVLMVTGSPGGSRIISTVLQVIVNVIDHGMNVAEAVAAPRIHHQWRPDAVLAEAGISPDTAALLRAKGHRVQVGATSGSASSILRDGETWTGAADPRQRGTLALGQ